jgi:hypothetical protein
MNENLQIRIPAKMTDENKEYYDENLHDFCKTYIVSI